MTKVLLAAAAVAALLAPCEGAPGPRRVGAAHVNPPRHGSPAAAAPAEGSAPVFSGTAAVLPSGGRAAAGGAARGLAAAGRTSRGFGRGARGGSGGFHHFGGGSFWGRRLDPPGGAPPNPSDYGIPSVLVEGQLIRTAGLGAVMSRPDAAPSTFAVDAGNKIAYEDSKGYATTTHRGVFTGPKDTPPPPNPLFGGSSMGSGGSGITENTNVQFNSHSNNGNGNGVGGGNGGN